jgi:glyoxylase I family protein
MPAKLAAGHRRRGVRDHRAMTPFEIQRVDHVSLNVSDRPRSIEWYRDVLGLELQREPRADDWPAFLGEDRFLALFQATASGGGPNPPESVGLRHFALATDAAGLERAKGHLADQGVEARFEDHGTAHSLYFRDPDGNTVELTTYDV